jgi:hypothetical protein
MKSSLPLRMKGLLYIFISLTLFCCGSIQSEQAQSNILNKETKTEESKELSENQLEKLKSIEANYSRISNIKNWTKIDTLYLEDESLDGGEAIFYFQGEQLIKVNKLNFGEMSRWLKEYYIHNGQLSFVIERQYHYNRYFLDPEFDFDKSEIVEDRSYFENGILVHQVNNQDCGSPFSKQYLFEEQKRITSDFENLIAKKFRH